MSTKSTSTRNSRKAQQLKSEGNSLHCTGRYQAAHKKYTDALEEDPHSAILWANRAATCLARRMWTQAATDARKAIELDSRFSKAYARLALAEFNIGLYTESILAWKNAINYLPLEKMSTPQKATLEKCYRVGLKTAETGLKRATEECFQVPTSEMVDFPNVRVSKMEQELNTTRALSSAWLTLFACKRFDEAIRDLNDLEVKIFPGLQTPSYGSSMKVTIYMSEALMRDGRVFHLDHDQLCKLRDQLALERSHYQAWALVGPQLVKKEALHRFKTNDYRGVAISLEITVRQWVIIAFLQDASTNKGYKIYLDAIEILEWGRGLRQVEPLRNAIFTPSYLRFIRRMYLRTLVQVSNQSSQEILNTERMNHVTKFANGLIADIDENPFSLSNSPIGGPITYTWYASSWLYPKAEAFGALGWCAGRTPGGIGPPGPLAWPRALLQAAVYYCRAANCLPRDEENYVFYLVMALERLWLFGAPLAMTLDLAERIRIALPGVNRIWENSPTMKNYKVAIAGALAFEKEYRHQISQGLCTIDHIRGPLST